MLNRNPNKRLGSGSNSAEDIKNYTFFKDLDRKATEQKRLHVPPPYMKALSKAYISLEKVYWCRAWDESLRDCNRLRQWSFVRKPGQ